MSVVWSLLALFASTGGVNLYVGEAAPPAWTQEAWRKDGAALIKALPDIQTITIAVSADLDRQGHLDIAAETEGSFVEIYLSGDGWREESDKGRRLLQQNLAHEFAHTGQLQYLDTAFEPVILHEGYAEARSLDLLVEARLWTLEEARRARLGMEARCEQALARGPLLLQAQAGDRDATYSCGAVLWFTAAEVAGTSVEVLHRSYAKAMMRPAGLGPWARETLGRDFTRSAVSFITTDFSGGAGTALEGLPAGRL